MDNNLFWTLADYQRFIHDPDFFAREWAVARIEEQYPQAAVESFQSLIHDEASHLQISAARAIIASPSPDYEADLLDALPEARSYVRRWILSAIGAVGSRTILPQLIRECDSIPDRHRAGTENTENLGIVDALGYYPEPEARAALWRLLERYRHDDTLSSAAVAGLLKNPEAGTFSRLTRLIQKLRPVEEFFQFSVIDAIAKACLVYPLANHLYDNFRDPDHMLGDLYNWMEDRLDFSEAFLGLFYKKAKQGYRGVLADILREADRYSVETGQKWSDWEAVWMDLPASPGSYPWRMAMAYQFMAAFAKNPPGDKKLYRRTIGLCLALLGQFVIDEDDESNLAAATTPEEEFNLLAEILNSPRQNVLPDIIERLAARGPEVLPVLIAALREKETYWRRMRALDTITRLAHLFPGAAGPAIPDILDQIQGEESEYVLDAAVEALKAIGPAVVKPAMERIDYERYASYDVYAFKALGEIPTEACVRAMLDYHQRTGEGDEFTIEIIAGLAHPWILPLLRSYYLEDPYPKLAEFCYKVAYLNQIDDPLLTQWKNEVLENRERRQMMGNLEEDLAAGKTAKREEPEQQPWENLLADGLDTPTEESPPGEDEEDEREKIEEARWKEAQRRAEAKEKAKRKQEKKSRKQSRKRK